MKPHAQPSASPFAAAQSIWTHRGLILEMTKRDVIGRYRGSMMGLAWSFFNPLLMLLAYTFVFGIIFKTRWPVVQHGSQSEFAVILFAGIIIHAFMADTFQRAPAVIINHANYVKKVVFPLEILPLVTVCSAFFHALVSIAVLLIGALAVRGFVPITAIAFPLIVLPMVFGILGCAWLLSSLGVYLRDVGQSVGIFTTMLMFLSPVFYPTTAVPEQFRYALEFSPLTYFIEAGRATLIFGLWPDWSQLLLIYIGSLLILSAGFWWFQRTRKGFADVL